MNFLITESQLRLILEGNDSSSLGEYMKFLYSFAKDVVGRSRRKFGIDLKLLTTWGSAIGGFAAPLDNFIRSKNLKISDDQISLILVGVIATLIFDNEKVFNKAYEIIKEEGLTEIFKKVLNKGKKLKDSFLDFISSLNVSFGNVASLIRYSFLIPIVTDIQSIAVGSTNPNETVSLIVQRLIAAGVVTIAAESLTKMIKGLVKKFR